MTAGRHASPRIDDAVAYRLYRSNRLLLIHLSRFLADQPGGLTPEKWFLLARVMADGPVRQVDLTDPALGDPPNVSRLVDALLRDGLVTRDPDPDDRRARRVALTARGREVATAIATSAVAVREAVFEGVDETALDGLVAALDRIDANVRAQLLA